MSEYPNDADGDALKRIADDGVDMTKPLAIEFQIAVSDEVMADRVVKNIENEGYSCKKDYDDVGDEWLVICPIRLIPSYENVVSTQRKLQEIVSNCDAQLVGWGALV